MRHPLDEIKQLQAWRGRGRGDPSIAKLVGSAGDKAERTHRRLGQLIDLWQELMPKEVVERSVLGGLRNGVLVVKVDSAATAFDVDRLLRGGVEADLRKRYRGTLLRVKTSVEPLDADDVERRRSAPRAAKGANRGQSPQWQRPSAGDAKPRRIGAKRAGR